MKFQTITMTFPAPLTQEQEKRVIGFFVSVKKGVYEKLAFSSTALRWGIGPQVGIIKARMQEAKDNLDKYIRLFSPAPGKYEFRIAASHFEYITEESIPSYARKYLRFLKVGERLKKRLPKDFCKYVRAEMKMDPNSVKFEFGEVESDEQNPGNV